MGTLGAQGCAWPGAESALKEALLGARSHGHGAARPALPHPLPLCVLPVPDHVPVPAGSNRRAQFSCAPSPSESPMSPNVPGMSGLFPQSLNVSVVGQPGNQDAGTALLPSLVLQFNGIKA